MSRGERAVIEEELLQKLELITGKTVVDLLHGTMYGICVVAARTGEARAFVAPPEFKWPHVDGRDPNARNLTIHDYVSAVNRAWRRGIGMGRLQTFDTAKKAKGLSIAAAIDALDDLKPGDTV